MRTAHTTLGFTRSAGGLQTSVSGLCRTLVQEQGIDVRVFGPRDKHFGEDLCGWEPVAVKALPAYIKNWSYMPRLADELAQFDPDLIHSHGLWLYPALATVGWHKRRHRPYMISPHGMLDPVDLAKSRVKKAVATWLYQGEHVRQASCLRALCESERDSIRRWGYRGPVCVIPNGVDLPNTSGSSGSFWAERVPPEKKVLLYLGRIHRKKGIRQLLDGLAELKTDSPSVVDDWVLAIVGWDQGNFETELARQAKSRDLEANVIFAGPLFGEQKADAYRSSHALVLPSTSEGLPNVVLEAWSVGLPVLMTPQSNIPEGFAAGAAVRADPDPQSLSEGLRTLFTMSENERREMGQQGLKIVHSKFTWSNIAAQMTRVFEWLVHGGPRPSVVEAMNAANGRRAA